MASHRINLLAGALPDTSGNVFWKPSSVDDVNDRFPHLILAFKDSGTKISASGQVTVPKNYVGTATVVGRWKTILTTGAVVFDLEYKAVAVAESLDPSTDDEALTVTDTAAGTARLAKDVTFTLTSANLASDDTLLYKISRDGVEAADTLAGEAHLEELWLQYADA